MNAHITDAQVDDAIANIGKIVEAASNSNQAGEDALMLADAAPQLYKALKSALPFLEAQQRDCEFEVWPLTEARAALAKANGETK